MREQIRAALEVFMADAGLDAVGIDRQQHEIAPAFENAVGGGDQLLRGGAMNKALAGEAVGRIGVGGARGLPVGLARDVVDDGH
jgi:hypothetical protein